MVSHRGVADVQLAGNFLVRMPSHIRLMICFSRPVSDEILAFSGGVPPVYAARKYSTRDRSTRDESTGRRGKPS